MGLLKKIFKPVSKVLDKIIPNELKPILPYAAAFAPYAMPGIMGIGGNTMLSRALMAGGTKFLSDDEADLKDVGITAALAGGPKALDSYVGGMDKTQGLGKFLHTAGKGKDAVSMAETISRYSFV